jgi:ribosome-associated protein
LNSDTTSTNHEPETENNSAEAGEEVMPNWQIAAWAADSRKAADIKVLDLTGVTTFTDTFLLCTATNSKQAQAITDAIQQELKKHGEHAMSIEGYGQGEWILSDYSDLIVHVFSEKSREFYDLDRLWREAKVVSVPANPKQLPDLPFSMNTAGMQIPKLAPFVAAATEPDAEGDFNFDSGDDLDDDDLNDE